jgi:hypothetical protein
MILNIECGVFGDCIRNGDLVAIANVVEYLRKDNPNLKFHILMDGLSPAEYVRDFHRWMILNTDYFSAQPGTEKLNWKNINLWDFRDISGDLVKIPNKEKMQKKIVVCPLLDAPYNTYRNWPKPVFESILQQYNSEEYVDHEKIICHPTDIQVDGWKTSTDFLTNIYHIMTSETFVGGDTGTTHFAWVLDEGPKNLIYYNSSRGLMHTLPFYALRGKGQINTYWLDFEGSKF